ncbi:MAG: hypothetical protein ACLP1X_30770 [Polyangiaceae bacterium]|jgi:hypothetical protein
MNRLVPFAVALVGLFACEQRFSSDPPLVPESRTQASSSGYLDALLAPVTDAGSVVRNSSHAMTITICASSPAPCRALQPDASSDESYLVVFGSGRGAVRSREQATTDLYQELRNRMAAGERLDVESHAPGDAKAAAAMGDTWTTKATAGSSDPIAQCAVHLFALVGRVGEVTIDVVHGLGSSGCLVSLGQPTDGGTPPCLVQEPERAKGPEGMGRGMTW